MGKHVEDTINRNGIKMIGLFKMMICYSYYNIPTIISVTQNQVINIKYGIKMEATEMKHLKKIVGKTKWDRIRNEPYKGNNRANILN